MEPDKPLDVVRSILAYPCNYTSSEKEKHELSKNEKVGAAVLFTLISIGTLGIYAVGQLVARAIRELDKKISESQSVTISKPAIVFDQTITIKKNRSNWKFPDAFAFKEEYIRSLPLNIGDKLRDPTKLINPKDKQEFNTALEIITIVEKEYSKNSNPAESFLCQNILDRIDKIGATERIAEPVSTPDIHIEREAEVPFNSIQLKKTDKNAKNSAQDLIKQALGPNLNEIANKVKQMDPKHTWDVHPDTGLLSCRLTNIRLVHFPAQMRQFIKIAEIDNSCTIDAYDVRSLIEGRKAPQNETILDNLNSLNRNFATWKKTEDQTNEFITSVNIETDDTTEAIARAKDDLKIFSKYANFDASLGSDGTVKVEARLGFNRAVALAEGRFIPN